VFQLVLETAVLARQFNPAAPNMAYVSDITYVRTGAGWLYLAVVIDLFSRKVVGWAMAPSMPAKLVCDALHMDRKPGRFSLVATCDRTRGANLGQTWAFILARHSTRDWSLTKPRSLCGGDLQRAIMVKVTNSKIARQYCARTLISS
jgi:hypothetical protein